MGSVRSVQVLIDRTNGAGMQGELAGFSELAMADDQHPGLDIEIVTVEGDGLAHPQDAYRITEDPVARARATLLESEVNLAVADEEESGSASRRYARETAIANAREALAMAQTTQRMRLTAKSYVSLAAALMFDEVPSDHAEGTQCVERATRLIPAWQETTCGTCSSS